MIRQLGFTSTLFCLAMIAGLTSTSASGALLYNFDTPGNEGQNGGHGDGAIRQGWTDVQGTSQPTGNVPGLALGGRTSVVPGNEDSQNNPLVFSSPAFNLTGTGSVSFDLSGGLGYGSNGQIANLTPSNDSLPTNPADVLAAGTGTTQGSHTHADNMLVVGLLDVASNAYAAYFQKDVNDNSWKTYSWDLSALANNGRAYQLQLIDNRDGGWGHLEIDNVSISGALVPEPSALTLAGIGAVGLFVAARRRRSA